MQNGISIFIKLHNILRIFIKFNIKNFTIVMIGVYHFQAVQLICTIFDINPG